MKKINISVSFDGIVEVRVPDSMTDIDAKELASQIALSRVFASADNPDAPDLDAFETYLETCSEEAKATAEEDFDCVEVLGVRGRWTLE